MVMFIHVCLVKTHCARSIHRAKRYTNEAGLLWGERKEQNNVSSYITWEFYYRALESLKIRDELFWGCNTNAWG